MKNRGNANNSKPGSPDKSEPEFLIAGKLRKSHGLTGEMWVELLTDFVEIFEDGRVFLIGKTRTPATVESFKIAGKLGLIKFEGYQNSESVFHLNNTYIYVKSINMPALQDGVYYHHELIGLTVQDKKEKILGELTEILVTGANDVYVIKPNDGSKELLIPAIKSVVIKIDLKLKKITIDPQEWDT
jgi:16S rRNA processing protein RimM